MKDVNLTFNLKKRKFYNRHAFDNSFERHILVHNIKEPNTAQYSEQINNDDGFIGQGGEVNYIVLYLQCLCVSM